MWTGESFLFYYYYFTQNKQTISNYHHISHPTNIIQICDLTKVSQADNEARVLATPTPQWQDGWWP